MRLSELFQKPVTTIVENDILKDIVQPNDTAKILLDKIFGRELDDILIVYVDAPKKRIKGVVTQKNVKKLLGEIQQNSKEAKKILVSDLKSWDKLEEIWLKKSDPILTAFRKFADGISDILIITDEEDVYSGKIKRKNATRRIRELIS